MTSLLQRLIPVVALVLSAFPTAARAQDAWNVELLGQLHSYQRYNDVWGYRAPDGTELAIMGTRGGTSIVNATDPANPVEVAFIPGPDNPTTDIKTYAHYAYIGSEGTAAGLQIVDLSDPLNPTLAGTFLGFEQVHNLYIDVEAAMLYAASPDNSGDLRIYSLADPLAPTLVAEYDFLGLHDVHVAGGFCYAFDLFQGKTRILDVSDLPRLTELSEISSTTFFPHSGWRTEDGNYLVTADEVVDGHLEVLDIRDPRNPVRVGEWLQPEEPFAIIHNPHVLGDLAFCAWYIAGLQVIDISEPRFPVRVGRYDTFPDPPQGGLFSGAFGVYPYQPSGVVYVSDRNTGLYLFRFNADYGTVSGQVWDEGSGGPVIGATVVVGADSVQTVAPDGAFHFALPPGEYQIQVGHPEYQPGTVSVQVAREEKVKIHTFLTPGPRGTVTGFVRDENDQAMGVLIEVQVEGFSQRTLTDAQGKFTLRDVPAGSRVLLLDHAAVPMDRVTVEVPANGVVDLVHKTRPAVFWDDFEQDRGWTMEGDGAEPFQRAVPMAAGLGAQRTQPGEDRSPAGENAMVTGPEGGRAELFDVDGTVDVLSPMIPVADHADLRVVFHRFFGRVALPGRFTEIFFADVSWDGGRWNTIDGLNEDASYWARVEVDLPVPQDAQEMQLRFRATGTDPTKIVNATVDDVGVFVLDGTEVEPQPLLRVMTVTPNPFAGMTEVLFSLGADTRVRVRAFDVAGRQVRTLVDDVRVRGFHAVAWDGRDDRGVLAGRGVYFLEVEAGGMREVRRVVRVAQ